MAALRRYHRIPDRAPQLGFEFGSPSTLREAGSPGLTREKYLVGRTFNSPRPATAVYERVERKG